ncbi:hypothetical protein H072_3850 [Dactylellina haptotyla CBS 200.50]|uniref:DUF3835 domain-containing protein n=1 Tax=Dactylellina haptotyla (strain CBS 200.50) TaxID=1284197 RepID=S8AH37_DACHA|nr:hypothetical protein H072_3850 [Dactylellina haptotyla CBS 200.50]
MDTVEVTEKQRKQLEESVIKLRKALKHWQVHSAEYEGLKEEILALPKTATRDDILAIADDFGGDVITREEITSFLGDREGIKRRPVQVAEAVRHRIDYVQENIDKIEKQLELGEVTLDNVRVIENSGQLTNEEGLPVMDIREELDDKGKIIKSNVNPAAGGSAQPFNVQAAIESFQPLVDTLAKKQKDKEDATKSKEKSKEKPKQAPSSSPSSSKAPSSAKPTTAAPAKKVPTKDQIQHKPKPTPKPQARTPKRIQATEKEYSPQSGMVLTEKRVKPALVPDVKEKAPAPIKEEGPSIKEIVAAPPEPTSFITSDEQLEEAAKKEGVARIRILEDDEDEDSDASDDPFENLPEVEETEEERLMREEMIKYNMREMNNIVAEIELDEEDDEEDDDDDDDYDYDDDDDDDDGTDDEEDDQWGRSKGQLVSDRVRREMMKLQKKIEAREKAAQVAAEVKSEPTDASIKPVTTVEAPPEAPKKEKKKSTEKKGVRFAEDLDIAPAPVPIIKPPSNASELVRDGFDNEDIDPSILDMVFGPGTKDQEERYFQNSTEEPKKKLPSLFKAARQVQKVKEQVDMEKSTRKKAPKPNVVERQTAPSPGSYEIIERTVSMGAPTPPVAPKVTGKMPLRKTAASKSNTSKAASKTAESSESSVLDPLGDELSDEDRPIMASSVIERAPTWQKPSDPAAPTPPTQRAPRAPDELDPDFHQREVTGAYFAMRNKLIQRQGGYVESEEEKTIVPIDENLDKRKVSRFKAGRVKNQLP